MTSSDDELQGGAEGDANLLKFRVIASARIVPVVSVDDATVQVGPPFPQQNTQADPSWLRDIPLPRVLASLATGSEVDADAWQRVATQAYTSGGLRGWDRASNCQLNSTGQPIDQYQWDVKLTRYMAPLDDPADPFATNNKYKHAKRCLEYLWRGLQAAGAAALPESLRPFMSDSWFQHDPVELADILTTAILHAPAPRGRHATGSRATRSLSPSRRPAPVAHVVAAPSNVKQQLVYLATRSTTSADMLFSDEALAALVNPQAPLPPTLLAPRWRDFPIVRGNYSVITDASQPSSPVVGEQFMIQFFDSARAATMRFPQNPQIVSPAVFNLPVSRGDDLDIDAEEQEPQPLPAPAPAPPVSESSGEFRAWKAALTATVNNYNSLNVPLSVSAIYRSEQPAFPLTQDAFNALCTPGKTGKKLFAKLLSYEQAEEMWSDVATYVKHKECLTLLLFYAKAAADRTQPVGYAMVGPFDVNVCLLGFVCTGKLVGDLSGDELRQVFQRLLPGQSVPADSAEASKQLLVALLQQYNVELENAGSADVETLVEEVDEAVANAVSQLGAQPLASLVHMQTTSSKTPLDAATVIIVDAFNKELLDARVVELYLACGAQRGSIQYGETMLSAVYTLLRNTRQYTYLCLNLEDRAAVNTEVLKAKGFKQAQLAGKELAVEDGALVTVTGLPEQPLFMYAFHSIK